LWRPFFFFNTKWSHHNAMTFSDKANSTYTSHNMCQIYQRTTTMQWNLIHKLMNVNYKQQSQTFRICLKLNQKDGCTKHVSHKYFANEWTIYDQMWSALVVVSQVHSQWVLININGTCSQSISIYMIMVVATLT